MPDDPPTVATQQATVPPDGAASVSSRGEPTIPPPRRDPSRKLAFDLTGFYESDPRTGDWNPSRMLQLNQAGQALVGWMTPPPRFVQPTQDFAVYCAVFVVDLGAPKTAKGYTLWYKALSSIEGNDPDKVLGPYDPWDTDSGWDGPMGFIDFQPASDTSAWDYASTKMSVAMIFQLADGNEARIDFLHKNPAARVSERSIAFQTEPLKTALIVRHRRPVPSTFFDVGNRRGQRWKEATDLFNGDPDGPLAIAIRRYFENLDGGAGPMAERELALGKVTELLGFPWLESPYKASFRLRLTALAAQSLLTLTGIDDPTRSYRDWFSSIAVREAASHLQYLEEHEHDFVAYPPEFDFVLGGTSIYMYEFAFEKLPAAVSGKVVRVLHGAALTFQVTVTKRAANLSQGGHLPAPDDFGEALGKATFYGAMLEAKFGEGGPPGLPSKVRTYSPEDLTPLDLLGSLFELYALDVGASTGLSASATAKVMKLGAEVGSSGNTQYIRIHVPHHEFPLEGSYEKNAFKPEPDWSLDFQKPDMEALKRVFSSRGIAKDSDFISGEWEKSFSAGVSVGLGYIGYEKTFSSWIRPARRVTSKSEVGADGRTVAPSFEVGKAELTKKVNGWDVRFLFESVLATDLALFNGVPRVDIEGSASPEYTPHYNLILSQMRAQAIKYALLDALGPYVAEDAVTARGTGDAQALAAGLHESDPTGDPADRDRFRSAHQEEVSRWPEFRKADVDIRGEFAIRVLTVDNDEG